jgi:hypothetical protein
MQSFGPGPAMSGTRMPRLQGLGPGRGMPGIRMPRLQEKSGHRDALATRIGWSQHPQATPGMGMPGIGMPRLQKGGSRHKPKRQGLGIGMPGIRMPRLQSVGIMDVIFPVA